MDEEVRHLPAEYVTRIDNYMRKQGLY